MRTERTESHLNHGVCEWTVSLFNNSAVIRLKFFVGLENKLTANSILSRNAEKFSRKHSITCMFLPCAKGAHSTLLFSRSVPLRHGKLLSSMCETYHVEQDPWLSLQAQSLFHFT